MQTQPETYNDKLVRQFTAMTVVWGIVGMAVGVFIAPSCTGPPSTSTFRGSATAGYGRCTRTR